jgi:hypothetical protein
MLAAGQPCRHATIRPDASKLERSIDPICTVINGSRFIGNNSSSTVSEQANALSMLRPTRLSRTRRHSRHSSRWPLVSGFSRCTAAQSGQAMKFMMAQQRHLHTGVSCSRHGRGQAAHFDRFRERGNRNQTMKDVFIAANMPITRSGSGILPRALIARTPRLLPGCEPVVERCRTDLSSDRRGP